MSSLSIRDCHCGGCWTPKSVPDGKMGLGSEPFGAAGDAAVARRSDDTKCADSVGDLASERRGIRVAEERNRRERR